MSEREFPAELLAPVPRRVRWRGLAYFNAASGFAFFFALPLLVIAASQRDVRIDRTLAERGQIAQGRVWMKSDRTASRAKHPRKQYRIDYAFRAGAASRDLTGEDFVSYDQYSRLSLNDTLAILYDPQNPAISEVDYPGRLAFRDTAGQLARAMDWAVILAGIGAAATVYAAMILWPRRRLLRWGVPAQAEITGGELRWSLLYRRRQAQLSYQFADAQGFVIVGYARRSRRFLEGAASRDSAVAAAWRNPVALFNPRDSRDNMLYGPDMYLRIDPRPQTSPSALASERASRASR